MTQSNRNKGLKIKASVGVFFLSVLFYFIFSFLQKTNGESENLIKKIINEIKYMNPFLNAIHN